MIRKRWAVAALGAAIGLVFGAASMVVAGAVVTTGQANALAVIKVVNSDSGQSTSSEDWVNLNGAVRRATSTGPGNLFVGRFVGASFCSGASCFARIVVKDLSGTILFIMNPDSVIFDTPDDNVESHALERSISGLPAGTYDFQVQISVQSSGNLDLSSWHFTLERYT